MAAVDGTEIQNSMVFTVSYFSFYLCFHTNPIGFWITTSLSQVFFNKQVSRRLMRGSYAAEGQGRRSMQEKKQKISARKAFRMA